MGPGLGLLGPARLPVRSRRSAMPTADRFTERHDPHSSGDGSQMAGAVPAAPRPFVGTPTLGAVAPVLCQPRRIRGGCAHCRPMQSSGRAFPVRTVRPSNRRIDRTMPSAPRRIIDAHHHLWDLDRIYYPWLTDEIVPDFLFGDYARIRRNYLPDDLRRDARNWNLRMSVHVEAE